MMKPKLDFKNDNFELLFQIRKMEPTYVLLAAGISEALSEICNTANSHKISCNICDNTIPY